MTAPEPHPLRCGTCHNKKCPEYKQRNQTLLMYHKEIADRLSEGFMRDYRSYSPRYFTELCGCASHSSGTDATIRKAERERVIYRLEKIKGSFSVLELKCVPDYKAVYDQIVDWIVELRQQGK